MKREFVETELFIKTWKALNLSDDELKELQNALFINPVSGTLIQGAGGARKLRIAFKGQGKSGGGRVIYVDFIINERIYLLMVYPKSKMESLSDIQKNYHSKID